VKRLYIVGTGPGAAEHLSPAARVALESCTDLVGYGLYTDLLGDISTGKNLHTSPLGQETERARLALELAASGRCVGLVSSGDAGIYAMATLVFELLDREAKAAWQCVEITLVPGITAAQAAASRVGAPLAHDFCAISLSDLLTPWETIEKRLTAAAEADFVLALYNPISSKRRWQLPRALQILSQHRAPQTPVVIARNVTRADESILVTSLAEVDAENVDMLSVVLIGNRETRCVGPWVYTPRGYAAKEPQH